MRPVWCQFANALATLSLVNLRFISASMKSGIAILINAVTQRRANAARELAKLSKRTGHTASPVVLDGRKIASTFWGKAWCDNLEAYSDYANRLPRGRTYVRNGSVVDLKITRGTVTARVSGSSLYTIEINIKPLAGGLWRSIQRECAGKIDSLIELLQGKLSSSVMQMVTRPERGLFPTPKEIELDCSCPDWADLGKHVAAALYGVGARLDHSPELLFLLRGVDPAELISKASAAEAVRQTAPVDAARTLAEKDLADVFGIELAAAATNSAPPAPQALELRDVPNYAAISNPTQKPKAKSRRKNAESMNSATRAGLVTSPRARWVKAKDPADRGHRAKRRVSPAVRARIAAAMKARWAAAKTRA